MTIKIFYSWKSSCFCYHWAKDVIHGRCPELEGVIIWNSACAYWYARDVIRGRFEKGEEVINSNSYWSSRYVEFLRGATKKKRLIEFDEKALDDNQIP